LRAGQGIAAHADHPTKFGEPIVSVSLGSDIVMSFDYKPAPPSVLSDRKTKKLKRTSTTGTDASDSGGGGGESSSHEDVQLLLRARSVLTMRGEARYQWRHAIAKRKSDSIAGLKFKRSRRVSLTFRLLASSDTGEPHHA
jgi:alkylated DNA repair dioxygenase AlkB